MAEIWMPMPSDDPAWRPASILTTLARLQSGVRIPAAEAALKNYAQTWGTPKAWGMTIVTRPFLDYLGGRLRPVLFMLMGAAGFVLLLVCANVASLQLVRATRRAREMAVRTAVGASRGALVRQSLVESLLLAAIGGTLGIVIGSALLDGLAAWHPASLPELRNARLNYAVLGFSTCASLLTGIAFGLGPALRSGRADVSLALKTASRSATNDRNSHRLLSGFAAAQISLAFLLLTGAFLLARSFGELVKADPGFRAARLVAMNLNLPVGRYSQPSAVTNFYRQLQSRLAGIPAVETAALTTNLPLSQEVGSSPLQIVGRPVNPAEPQPHAERLNVSPEYFSALGIPLLRGRVFEPADASPSQPVVLIDAQLAREYFSGENPIGKQIRHSGPVATIIGVVGSTSQKEVGGPPKPTVYYFIEQYPRNPVTLVLRTSFDIGSTSALVRNVISQIDANVPIANVRTVEQQVNDSLGARQFGVYIVSGFAALALILSIIGIYGVLSYVSRERTQEFGIRLAMGAQVRDIVAFVLWRGARLTAAGLLTGLAASLILTRALSNQLYRIAPHDPLTLLAVTGILATVALLASSLPAWRAGRVDPAIALRDE
jgi:putative ABC transport system permease protein